MFLLKIVHKEKKNTKSQPNEIVREIMNFGSIKLTKSIKKILEQNSTTYS